MKAAFADRYGPPEVVELREVERPAPSDDEVLVRVRAASVNRADLDGLKPKPGFVRLFMGLRAPRNHEVGHRRRRRRRVRRAGRHPLQARRRGHDRPVRGRAVRCLRRVRLCAREGLRADPDRHVVRRVRHAAALGGPGAPGNANAERPDRQARRRRADRRRVRQRRSVRRPDRQVDGCGGDRRRPGRQARLRALARRRPCDRLREGRLHQGRPSATTGSWRSIRTTRSVPPAGP